MKNNNSGVDDRVERIGEIILAIVGTCFAIIGNVIGTLSDKWAVIALISSFALYQSTSVFKYYEKFKGD